MVFFRFSSYYFSFGHLDLFFHALSLNKQEGEVDFRRFTSLGGGLLF